MTEGHEDTQQELNRVKQQLASVQQLFEVYKRTTLEQASKLEHVVEEQKRAERHLAVQYETALALAESATVQEAMPRILRAICGALSWEHGCFWRIDGKEQLLCCVETWRSPHFELAEFDRMTRASVFSPGIGLPGRVWASRRPSWIADVTQDANFPRAVAASKAGLHGAFGFPILLGGEVRGVMEFFSRQIRPPDDGLLRVLTSIGNHIGQVTERRQAEESLRQSEERTRSIIETALDAVVTMDEEGVVTGWNAEAERTFGWPSAQAVGRRMSDLVIPSQYRQPHETGLRHFQATGEGRLLNKRFEITALHRDGNEFPVELAITPVRLGGSWTFSGFVRNITERKRSEAAMRQAKEAAEAARLSELESSALLRQIIEEIDVAVLAFDAAGDVKLLNRAAHQLLNLPSEQGLNRSATELGLAELLEGEAPRTLELRIGNGSGPWELRRGRFRQAGLPHTLVVLADLRRALREEERQAWQRLVRVLSHEINNSLAPILSIASGLQELLQAHASAGEWVQDVRDGLAVVERRSAGLSRFMAAYAQLARLPPPRLAAVELGGLVRRTAAFEQRLSVKVAAGPPLSVRADADQLEQLLINLIRNAADAALETGGGVEVSWRQNGGTAEILVADQGPGLLDSANLFVPFFTTKPQGSGIGLVLSRQIAEAHSGSLTLHNAASGQGCNALLQLPVHPA